MSFETFPSSESMEHPLRYVVPENELTATYARSGGAGGQNVNKRDTKAQISWHILGSSSFTDEQKVILERELMNWINSEGCVVIQNQETRSREQNRSNAISRLNALVTEALTPEKERIATKPTRSSRERRLEDKSHESKKKAERREKDWES
jgi:ribosome-associated protein